jgi:hypothetical protein
MNRDTYDEAVTQEIFDMIKDPDQYKFYRADEVIRSQLVKIKDAIDTIDNSSVDLGPAYGDPSVASVLQNITTDIEDKTIEIVDHLENLISNIERRSK